MQTKNYFYVLNNNFSYTQPFLFSSERFSHDDNGAFFAFSSSEKLLYQSKAFFQLCPFSSSERF